MQIGLEVPNYQETGQHSSSLTAPQALCEETNMSSKGAVASHCLLVQCSTLLLVMGAKQLWKNPGKLATPSVPHPQGRA